MAVVSLASNLQVAHAGGKAASLARLISFGQNVPAGFVITVDDFGTMSDQLRKYALEAFEQLETTKVAVRSSGVQEDSSGGAWAGQFDTFLNVTKDDLIEKIEACWRSASSQRSQAYAQDKQTVGEGSKLAVIVQQMIAGEVSGVAFSVHPVTKNSQHIVIEASAGLGESVVSGTVTPSLYVVDKQSKVLVEGEGDAVLNQEKIQQLAQEITKIEQHFGYPVDVEWTFTADELWILQARPITTL